MSLILAIFVFFQGAPNEASLFLIKVAGFIVAAIITGVATFFQTQSNRRYKEFNSLKEQTTRNTSDIEKNTIHDKNRNDNFKNHEERMEKSEKAIKDFLTEYKKDMKADWKDFKKEVKEEISLLRKEIHNNK